MEEIAGAAFAEMGEFVRWDDSGIVAFVSSAKLSQAQRAAIKKIRTRSVTVARPDKNGGEVSTTTTYTEIELHDKLGALEKLAKHLGLYHAEERESPGTPDLLMQRIYWRFVAALHLHGPDGKGMPFSKARQIESAHPDVVDIARGLGGLLSDGRCHWDGSAVAG